MSPVDSDGSLRQVVGADKLDVERPDSAVLGEREGLQGSVEGTPCLRDLSLVHEELTVVQPDTRHLHTYSGTSNREHSTHTVEPPIENTPHTQWNLQ